MSVSLIRLFQLESQKGTFCVRCVSRMRPLVFSPAPLELLRIETFEFMCAECSSLIRRDYPRSSPASKRTTERARLWLKFTTVSTRADFFLLPGRCTSLASVERSSKARLCVPYLILFESNRGRRLALGQEPVAEFFGGSSPASRSTCCHAILEMHREDSLGPLSLFFPLRLFHLVSRSFSSCYEKGYQASLILTAKKATRKSQRLRRRRRRQQRSSERGDASRASAEWARRRGT